MATTPNLKSANSRHYEFSQTWRCYPRIRHTFNSGRYNFHQNRPSELKVMIDFPKFLTKYVAANLYHFSPRRTYSIALRGTDSPSLQAMCYYSCGSGAFLALSPRQGRQKRTSLKERLTFRKICSNKPTLTLVILALQNFPGPLAFRISNYNALTPFWKLFTKI